MTFDQVRKHYGSIKAIADALAITPGAVQRWKRENKIPYDRQCQIQVDTRNKLKATKSYEPLRA